MLLGQRGSSAWAAAANVVRVSRRFSCCRGVLSSCEQRLSLVVGWGNVRAMSPNVHIIFLAFAVVFQASAEQLAAFDSASASSIYLGSGDFSPAAAISGGSSYWSSSGNHADGKPVSWTGVLNVRRKAIGVKVNWSVACRVRSRAPAPHVMAACVACRAYGPGEVKILASADGGNFEEVVPWRRSTKGDAAYVETFMFAEPRNVMAVSVLMRDPQLWRFMGITNAVLLVEPGPFMLVSGVPAPDGELCVVARNGALEVQPCLAAIVAGDGVEIFTFGVDGELVSASNSACASLANGLVVTHGAIGAAWFAPGFVFVAVLSLWGRADQTLQHLNCKRRGKSKLPAMEMFVWRCLAPRRITL